jgi:hypothetical protein
MGTESPYSHTILERGTDGLRLTLPPVGVTRVGDGRLWYALFLLVCAGLCGGMLAFLLGVLAESGRSYMPGTGEGWAALVGTGAWLMGLLCWAFKELIWSVQMGYRHVTLEYRAGVLHIRHMSLFGIRTWQWPREQIAALYIDRRGGRQGGFNEGPRVSPIEEVRIQLSNGRTSVLLAGRDARETAWIVSLLHEALYARDSR